MSARNARHRFGAAGDKRGADFHGRVPSDDGDEADDVVVNLMSDIVAPRCEFIQENALSVANLDV